jgi:hypothetical protein
MSDYKIHCSLLFSSVKYFWRVGHDFLKVGTVLPRTPLTILAVGARARRGASDASSAKCAKIIMVFLAFFAKLGGLGGELLTLRKP